MLKLEFNKDYKVFKAGTRINFFDEVNRAYNILGKNETGKSLYLGILEYAFSGGNEKRIIDDLNVTLSYNYLDENDEFLEDTMIFIDGIGLSKNADRDLIFGIINKIIQEIDKVFILSRSYNVSDANKELIQNDNNFFTVLELFKNSSDNTEIDFLENFKGGLKSSTYKQLSGGQLVAISEPLKNKLSNAIENANEIIGKIVEENLEEIRMLRNKLKCIKLRELDFFKEFLLFDTKQELINENKGNNTNMKFLDMLNNNNDLDRYYDSDIISQEEGINNLIRIVNNFNDKFFNYYKINDTSNIDTTIKLINSRKPSLVLQEGDTRLEFSNKSEGFKFWITMFIHFESILNSKNNLILLDEVGYNLHLSSQEQFREYIESDLSKNNIVVWTTHSPCMVTRTSNFKIFKRDGRYSKVLSGLSNDFCDNEYILYNCSTLINDTSISHFNLSEKTIVLVEGYSDLLILRYFLEKRHLTNKYHIFPVGGVQHFKDFIPLFLYSHDEKLIILGDRDEGNRNTERIYGELKKKYGVDIQTRWENLEELYPSEIRKKVTIKNKITIANEIIRKNRENNEYDEVFKKIEKLNIFN